MGVVIALVLRYTPHKTADTSVLRTAVYPAHTVFKSNSILVGHDQVQDDLYVLTTVRIDDRLHLPLFLKDFTATLTTADGEELTTSATEQPDLPNLYTTFPALKALASEPLTRETMIDPGGSAQGMILLHFPVTQDVWNHRRSAIININLYHQGNLYVTIPPGSETVHNSSIPTSDTTTSE